MGLFDGFGGLGGSGDGMNSFVTNPLILASLQMMSNNTPRVGQIPDTFNGVPQVLLQSGLARQKQIDKEKEQAKEADAQKALENYFTKYYGDQQDTPRVTEPPQPVEAPPAPPVASDQESAAPPPSTPNLDALSSLAKSNSAVGDNRYADFSKLPFTPSAAPQAPAQAPEAAAPPAQAPERPSSQAPETAQPAYKTAEDADKFVSSFNPNLPEGVRTALSKLTTSSGAGWADSDLGQALKVGDLDKAKELLPAYAAKMEQEKAAAEPLAKTTEQRGPAPDTYATQEQRGPVTGAMESGQQPPSPGFAPPTKTAAAAATYAQNRTAQAAPPSAPAQAAPTPALAQAAPPSSMPQEAPAAPVTKTDQAIVAHAARSDPRDLARILSNPRINAGVKSLILQQQESKYQLQTLPDGTIVRIDPKRGTVDEIYRGPSKDKWEFKKIGSDMSGDQMGWINERTREAIPYKPNGASGGDNSIDAVAAKVDGLRSSGITEPEKLAEAIPDRGVKEYTKALLRGDALPSNLGNRAGPIRANAIQMAHIIDPNFREEQITMRQTFARNLASSAPNSIGSQVRSSSTVVEHLGSGLDNLEVVTKGAKGILGSAYGEQPELNRIRAVANRRANDENYNKALGGYEVDSRAVAGEVVRLLTGGQGSEKDRREWLDRFDITKNSLGEVRGAWNEAYNIMYGRLSSVAAQKEQAWGQPVDPLDLLPRESRSIIQRVRGGAASGTKGYSPEDVEAEIRRRGLK